MSLDALKWCRRLGYQPTDSAFRIIDKVAIFYSISVKL